jgi:hypothetical protein
MRGLVLATLFVSFAIGSAFADEGPRTRDRVTVQLPSGIVARLPASQQPGDMRRAYLKNQEQRTK